MKDQIINQDIRELEEYQFPTGLHGQIMRRLLLYRAMGPIIATAVVLVLNSALLGWNIYSKAVELQTFSVVQAMLDGFSLTTGYLSDFTTNLVDALPLVPAIALLCNLIVGFYVVRLVLILSRFHLDQQGRMVKTK